MLTALNAIRLTFWEEEKERAQELEDVHGGEGTMGRVQGRRGKSTWPVQEIVGVMGLWNLIGEAWRIRGESKAVARGFEFPTRNLGFTWRKWEAGRVYFE